MEIFSQRLKREYLLLRNFSSKTNLQARKSSERRMTLRKLVSPPKTSGCSLMRWSSFRISFLMRLLRASYFDFFVR